MSDQRLKIAVFIDFDNVEIGVKTTLGRQFDVGAVLEAIKERGEIITKVAYGDWKRAGDHGRAMAQHAIRLVQRVMTPGGDKNGADINLALDALEMAFTHDHINAFVIVGGDSDFITLVEKLKQYDKKVFVVGGRAFTSQVMQKNCTEFIAYENVTGSADRQRSPVRPERERGSGPSALDQAFPLVKRALKVLADREVSPQLGLLKSTLLQLDSSFSERDYGAGTFRDFAEKLEKSGFVTLKHSGRTTVVELSEDGADDKATASEPVAALPASASDGGDETAPPEFLPASAPNLAEGVALVRTLLGEATTPPRWPMYLRQMKQFIRASRPDFDERRYGSLPDLMRACAKEGFLRLERDRQGGLRLFAPSTPTRPSLVRHQWTTDETDAAAEAPADAEVSAYPETPVYPDEPVYGDSPADAEAAAVPVESSTEPEPPADMLPPVDIAGVGEPPAAGPSDIGEPEDDQLAMFGVVRPGDPEPNPKRPTRGRKTPSGGTRSTRGRTKNDDRRPRHDGERRPPVRRPRAKPGS